MRGELVFIVLIIICLIPVLAALYFRYKQQALRHRERMAAIEKGAELPLERPVEQPWTPRRYLLKGMMWAFTGVALIIFLTGLTFFTRRPEDLDRKLSHAQRLRDMGATEEQVKQVMDDKTPKQGVPGGIALIGLVPVAVGAAYLIYFRTESRASLVDKQGG